MDKISSILPNNKRMKNDVDESHPARPGTTSLGRTMGTTASEREKLRQAAADKAELSRAKEALSQTSVKDSVEISDQGKHVAQADTSNLMMAEKENLRPTSSALKAYVEEMAGEPSFEKIVSPDKIRESQISQNPIEESLPKPAAPSFFVDSQPKTTAAAGTSAHTLDKYA